MTQFNFTIPTEPVLSPACWTRTELEQQGDWVHHFSAQNLAEINLAVQQLRARGLQAPHFAKADFPLQETAKQLADILTDLEHGRGFVLLRGLPMAQYSVADAQNIFWGLSLYLGQAVAQNADGHLLGHVRDLGFDLKNPNVRNYQTTEELRFHNDSCDVLGLMCLQQAKSGGHSAIASVEAIHNALLTQRPDLLPALYQLYYIDRRGELGWPDEGDEPYFALPIFTYYKNQLTARYTVPAYYYEAQRFEGVPAMTEQQIEALELLGEIALNPEFHITYDLQPGDIQLVNNYSVFHSRTSYQDHSEPERKRHLLRLWLSVPNSRALHPVFKKRWRSVKPGAVRGGIAPGRRVTITA